MQQRTGREYVARIRSPTVVAENEDGGSIKVPGEECTVKQYCCQTVVEHLQHSRTSQLAPTHETGKNHHIRCKPHISSSRGILANHAACVGRIDKSIIYLAIFRETNLIDRHRRLKRPFVLHRPTCTQIEVWQFERGWYSENCRRIFESVLSQRIR